MQINSIKSTANPNFKGRFLHLEDEFTTQALLLNFANKVKGTIVDTADSFEKGIKAMQETKAKYNGIITDGDISTKDDGLEIVKTALKKGYKPEDIVMISANKELEPEVTKLGCRFFSKPIQNAKEFLIQFFTQRP